MLMLAASTGCYDLVESLLQFKAGNIVCLSFKTGLSSRDEASKLNPFGLFEFLKLNYILNVYWQIIQFQPIICNSNKEYHVSFFK